MSPILELQQRYRELGRIRMGAKGERGNPVKLEAWRLTSSNRHLLEEAAALWGGEVREWNGAPNEGTHELYTKAASLPIVIPPGREPVTQWMEQWSRGGCTHRCDTRTNHIDDTPCTCDPSDPVCKPTTRLNVMLPDLPDVGVWRLNSTGWNAASELPGTLNLIQAAAAAGQFLDGALRLEQRSQVKQGKTSRFVVPVIDLNVTTRELISGQQSARELTAGKPAELPGRMELEAPRPVVTDDHAPVDVDVAYAQLVVASGRPEAEVRKALRTAGIANKGALADKQTLTRAMKVAEALRPVVVSTDPDDHEVIDYDEGQEAMDV